MSSRNLIFFPNFERCIRPPLFVCLLDSHHAEDIQLVGSSRPLEDHVDTLVVHSIVYLRVIWNTTASCDYWTSLSRQIAKAWKSQGEHSWQMCFVALHSVSDLQCYHLRGKYERGRNSPNLQDALYEIVFELMKTFRLLQLIMRGLVLVVILLVSHTQALL